MSGSQMRYNVFAGDQLVALLSFGASAWKLAPRESCIGWAEHQRLKNLQLVVNNARFSGLQNRPPEAQPCRLLQGGGSVRMPGRVIRVRHPAIQHHQGQQQTRGAGHLA